MNNSPADAGGVPAPITPPPMPAAPPSVSAGPGAAMEAWLRTPRHRAARARPRGGRDMTHSTHPVDDTAFTRPLIRGLQQRIDLLAAGIPGRDAYRTAAAWVYTSVLIAWAEDHGLIPTRLRADAAWQRARHQAAGGTAAGWILEGLADLAAHPATACLADPHYNPAAESRPTGEACADLIGWWSTSAPDLSYPNTGDGPASITGWLPGDLLQLVTDERRLAHALCQTPWWVCDFLCERTLVPAVAAFGAGTRVLRVIDPACGTGHILNRVMIGLYQWYRSTGDRHPGCTPREAIRRTLAGLAGVELDPLTAAVARLRTLVTAAALLAGDGALPAPLRLHRIPATLRPRIAVGNALLAGRGDPHPPGTILDDTAGYPGILDRGTYHAVIANPPYITVKDPVVNRAIRTAYPVCSGTYSLAVPFAVLTFNLAIRGRDASDCTAGTGVDGSEPGPRPADGPPATLPAPAPP